MNNDRTRILFVLATVAAIDAGDLIWGAGAWNGQDLLHVPMSWCVVQGSPAQANPNIVGTNGVADTNTDAVIWRRHERPTDNIYINASGISLRSAINNSWGSLNFPIIADPDTTNGTMGDVNGWNVNTDGTEFNTLINNCDTAYTNIGRAGIGITTVDIGLFHDNANAANDGNAQWDYVTIIGWGGCAETAAGVCSTPFDGRIMVIDNRYLYPTVADRTFPPSPADPAGNLRFVITDSLDQLTGHEGGHALSLNHRNDVTALMNPSSTDNDGNGDADNIGLNAAEVTALRSSALVVPGLETDPPAEFLPGRYVGMRLTDTEPDPELDPQLDLASVRMVLDRAGGRLYVDEQLMGLIPGGLQDPPAYWLLTDLDGNSQTGCSAAGLRKLGLVSEFPGSDLVARARFAEEEAARPTASRRGTTRTRVNPRAIKPRKSVANGALPALVSEYFTCPNGEPVPFFDDRFDVRLLTMRMHPHFAPIGGLPFRPNDFTADLHHIVQFAFAPQALGLEVLEGAPVGVQAAITRGGATFDLLDDGDQGRPFIMAPPSFPHCFPAGDADAGGTVEVRFDGLLPNREIHALLGPDEVLRGVTTDAHGAGTIELPVPAGTAEGLHLVTIGHDALALTADCTLAVRSCTATDTTPPAIGRIRTSRASLWPPNHTMIPVELTVTAGDTCDPDPACHVTGVRSDEPIDGTGDGDSSPDWTITGPLSVDLRSERAGLGDGRVYTIEIACEDDAGNASTGITVVSVPHDQRGRK